MEGKINQNNFNMTEHEVINFKMVEPEPMLKPESTGTGTRNRIQSVR